MNDLVRFLLACIEADEAAAKKLSRQRARSGSTATVDEALSPERLRTECLAKRQLIGHLQQLYMLRDQPLEKPVRDAAAHMLQSLALPYASKAGYREDWGKVPVS
jgi:hypothetical protein